MDVEPPSQAESSRLDKSGNDAYGRLRYPLWLNTIEDDELRREIEKYDLRLSSADAIRTTFVIFENRLRSATGAGRNEFGTKLVGFAFEPTNGVLQPVSEDGGERSGFHEVLSGAFKLYRNSVAHQSTQYDESEVRRILTPVDHGLSLVRSAIETAIPLSKFVGTHEGEILHRRVFRFDIDRDGNNEVVIMLGHGPVWQNGEKNSHFSTVILKESAEGIRRVITESVPGSSMHGPISVVPLNCTNNETVDLVVTWAIGKTQNLVYVLRKAGDRFVLAKRDIPDAGNEHYNRPVELGFTNHPTWNSLSFADVDGDGIQELIRDSLFPKDALPEDVPNDSQENEWLRLRSAVWKWNPDRELFEVRSIAWLEAPPF